MLRPLPSLGPRRQQRGIVLLMAMVVLIALTLAGVALTRSVYTSNIIAGNLAFQQAATHAADTGVEDAVAWLENNSGMTTSATAVTCDGAIGSTVLACNQPAHGYLASKQEPTGTQSWADFWKDNLANSGYVKAMPADNSGNSVSYVIQRMCSGVGDAQSTAIDCSTTPNTSPSGCGASSCDVGQNLSSVGQVYYRITVRVVGPRNTQSYVQSIVAL